jgi:hypothetical protein
LCGTRSSARHRKIVGAPSRERSAFISRFVDSRNYYTHYSPELENKAATGTALYLLVVQLRAIIEMSLLRELGFSCEAIDAILERVRRYDEIQNVGRRSAPSFVTRASVRCVHARGAGRTSAVLPWCST